MHITCNIQIKSYDYAAKYQNKSIGKKIFQFDSDELN